MLASAQSATLLGVEGAPSGSRSTSPRACPASRSSACPTPPVARRATGRAAAALDRADLAHVPGDRQPGAAGLRKVGAGLDLAIAVALLAASEQVPAGAADGRAFVGELGLDGSVRPCRACCPSSTPGRARGGGARGVHGRGAARGPPRRAPVATLGAWSARWPGRRPGPTPPSRPPPAARPRARPRRRPGPARRPLRRSRWPRPAGTTCCWSARPARARPCSPGACRACCPT